MDEPMYDPNDLDGYFAYHKELAEREIDARLYRGLGIPPNLGRVTRTTFIGEYPYFPTIKEDAEQWTGEQVSFDYEF